MKSYTANLSWWDQIMSAVTFAEANEPKAALTFLTDQTDRTEPKSALHQHQSFGQDTNITAQVN